MAYLNSGAAYDLSAYEQAEQRAKPDLKIAASRKVRKGTSLFSMRVISYFAVVVTLLVLIVYNQVQINEVSGELNRLGSQISKMESENVRMTSELEAVLSLRSIGEQAKSELGMSRLDPYQTVYICLEQQDKSVLTENSPSLSPGEQIQMTIKAAISRLQEYIAGE